MKFLRTVVENVVQAVVDPPLQPVCPQRTRDVDEVDARRRIRSRYRLLEGEAENLKKVDLPNAQIAVAVAAE